MLEKLEKEILETEKLYQESLQQEIQKQENNIELSQLIDSKIAEFKEKAKKLNLTKLKFTHKKDNRSLGLTYINQNGNKESIFYVYDYNYSIKLDIINMLDFHVKNIEIYNQLINELPEDFFNYINYYYDKNVITISKEQTSHSIQLSEDSNNIEIQSYIDMFNIESFDLKLNNNLKLKIDMLHDSTEINLELSRTSIVQLKDIAKQINQDMADLNYQIDNNFTINYQ